MASRPGPCRAARRFRGYDARPLVEEPDCYGTDSTPDATVGTHKPASRRERLDGLRFRPKSARADYSSVKPTFKVT